MLLVSTGNKCRACGGLLVKTDDGAYVCEDCGQVHEVTDMFMP